MMSGHAYNHTLRAHFLTQRALVSTLLSQSSITHLCKIYQDGPHGENAWQMLYRTQEWLPWINNLCKNMFGNIVALDIKPGFGSRYSILSHWFNISSSHNAEDAGPYIWRSPERDYIYFMQVHTFIMQNWCTYTIRRCAPCRMDMSKDEFHSYTIRLEGPEDPHLRSSRFRRSRDPAHASIPLAQTPWGLTGRAWLRARAQRVAIVELPPLNSLGIESRNADEGFFTIRCSDRFWGGAWSDMTTEQVLTCTEMVSGGLTWGYRITGNTLAKWVRASLYTSVYPNWGAQWLPGQVFWAVLWGMSS